MVSSYLFEVPFIFLFTLGIAPCVPVEENVRIKEGYVL